MNSTIREQIEYRRAAGGPFLAAWYPLVEPFRNSLVDWMVEASSSGADLVTLEVPSATGVFFDPAGEILCRLAPESIGLEGALELLSAARAEIDAPVLLSSHVAPLLEMSVERVAEQALASGVDAISVIDLALDEGSGIADRLRDAGLTVVLGATVAADRRRIQNLSEASEGLLWGQDPFDPTAAEAKVALRDHRRMAKKTGSVLLADPSELPTTKMARKMSGILLRRFGAALIDSGVALGGPVSDALREFGGDRG